MDAITKLIGPLVAAAVTKDVRLDADGFQERFVVGYFYGRVKLVALSNGDKGFREPLCRRVLHFGWDVTANSDKSLSAMGA